MDFKAGLQKMWDQMARDSRTANLADHRENEGFDVGDRMYFLQVAGVRYAAVAGSYDDAIIAVEDCLKTATSPIAVSDRPHSGPSQKISFASPLFSRPFRPV